MKHTISTSRVTVDTLRRALSEIHQLAANHETADSVLAGWQRITALVQEYNNSLNYPMTLSTTNIKVVDLSEHSVAALFLEAHCELDGRQEIAIGDLYRLYAAWTKMKKYRPLSKIAFNRHLVREYGWRKVRNTQRAGMWVWDGVTLKSDPLTS